MRRSLKLLAVAATLLAALAGANVLHAHDPSTPDDRPAPMAGHDGMMGENGMMGHDGMMGKDGMMKMMFRMSAMMENCQVMMRAMQSQGPSDGPDQPNSRPPATQD